MIAMMESKTALQISQVIWIENPPLSYFFSAGPIFVFYPYCNTWDTKINQSYTDTSYLFIEDSTMQGIYMTWKMYQFKYIDSDIKNKCL